MIDKTIRINVTTVRNDAMHKQCNMQINQMLHHVAHVDWCVQLTEIRIMILCMAYKKCVYHKRLNDRHNKSLVVVLLLQQFYYFKILCSKLSSHTHVYPILAWRTSLNFFFSSRFSFHRFFLCFLNNFHNTIKWRCFSEMDVLVSVESLLGCLFVFIDLICWWY